MKVVSGCRREERRRRSACLNGVIQMRDEARAGRGLSKGEAREKDE